MAKNMTGFPNREFLQLAQTYDIKKHACGDWFISEKLDGVRCFWDGGITRGMSIFEVPFANTVRETINRGEGSGNERICTGLWSRYAKPIHAPNWFLDQLPLWPLDGELWIGRGRFQELVSVVKGHVVTPVRNEQWKNVQYRIFDAPSYQQIFAQGFVNNVNYVMPFDNRVWEWIDNLIVVKRKDVNDLLRYGLGRTFVTTQAFLKKELTSGVAIAHDQERLPIHTNKAMKRMEELLEEISCNNGEGLILRDPNSEWQPKRNEWMLKVKKLKDMEGIVIGYRWGTGKLEGLMGSIGLLIKGKDKLTGDRYFELSGFNDNERQLIVLETGYSVNSNNSNVDCVPGEIVSDNIGSQLFPRGSTITFTYRELTNDGLPREARYLRKI